MKFIEIDVSNNKRVLINLEHVISMTRPEPDFLDLKFIMINGDEISGKPIEFKHSEMLMDKLIDLSNKTDLKQS